LDRRIASANCPSNCFVQAQLELGPLVPIRAPSEWVRASTRARCASSDRASGWHFARIAA
jgi:hypothetical protein